MRGILKYNFSLSGFNMKLLLVLRYFLFRNSLIFLFIMLTLNSLFLKVTLIFKIYI